MKSISKRKYIFITGGVISGLGKGVTTASIAYLLKNQGLHISVIKVDMYLNQDAGTMNPLEHGEVFVTEDGMETDQDIGHYERFLDQNILRHHYITLGQIYQSVLNKERQLDYKGKCIEGHIHIPLEIISRIKEISDKDNSEITLIEVGGTVGEYQNIMLYEAIRRMKYGDPLNVFLIHLVYLIVPSFLGEMKSKPAQLSIYDLYKVGIHPNFVICRSDRPIDEKRKNTISFNTAISEEKILNIPNLDSVYRIPQILEKQNFTKKLSKEMGIVLVDNKNLKLFEVMQKTEMLNHLKGQKQTIKIAIAGKYFKSGQYKLEDSYVCVIEAIKHAAWASNSSVKTIIQWFDVERMENNEERIRMENELKEYQGVIVPQGWGSRGVEGKVNVAEFSRRNKIPYLGLCFGMQMAVIEYARNILVYKDANSEEVNPDTKHPVIHTMSDQKGYLESKNYGGTMRLGAYPCVLKTGTILETLYKKFGNTRLSSKGAVTERHRHRYEFNNEYRALFEKNGLIISGTSPDNQIVEAIELPERLHPFFIGTQFHPEYKSSPSNPHPIFMGFIKAMLEQLVLTS